MTSVVNKKCIISDIDGTLLYHHGGLGDIETEEPIILPGVKEKFNEWNSKGYYIVLITARPQRMERLTREHLEKFNLKYDRLFMEITNYPRYILNDSKPYADMIETCFAYSVKRDKGLEDISI